MGRGGASRCRASSRCSEGSTRSSFFVDHRPRLLDIQNEEKGLDTLEALQVVPAPDRTKHKERIVERIALRSCLRDDRDAQHALHGPTGSWIHDWGKPNAVDFEKLL